MLLCTLSRDMPPWLVPPSSPYSEHVQCYDELRHIEPSFQSQQSTTWATFRWLNGLSERSVCCVHRAALRKVQGIEPPIDNRVVAALRDIRNDLDKLERERRRRSETVQVEDALLATQIAQFETQKLDTIQLAFSLFEAPSILDGLSTARTRSIAKRLISSLQKLTPKTAPINQHFNSYLYNAKLVLSGMTLHPREVTERNYLSFSKDTN